MTAAPRAVMPMAMPPQPGTAVKEPARSMVSRMKRRLSRARSSRATGAWERRGIGKRHTTSVAEGRSLSSTLCRKVCARLVARSGRVYAGAA